MDREPVESKNLKSVGYDPDVKILEVEFCAGPVYRYKDVPYEVYDTLMRSDSKGAYFGMAIRKKYEFEKEIE